MGHSETDPKYYNEVVEFAQQIGMIPLKLKKEQPGYILNSLLVPFLNAGQALLANDVADPETIDLTWVLGTGAPAGPFRILDIVGLDTAYNIVIMNPEAKDLNTIPSKIAKILKEYIDAGKKELLQEKDSINTNRLARFSILQKQELCNGRLI